MRAQRLTSGRFPEKRGRGARVKLGMCGDSAERLGPNQFRLEGAGLDITWEAGQSVYGSTHVLPPTPDKNSGTV